MKTLLYIIFTFISMNTYSQSKECFSLKIYAYPMNTFTKIPITANGIKDAATFKHKIKNGNSFIEMLEKRLASKEEYKEELKSKGQVRIYIEVYNKKNIISDIIIHKGVYVEYKNKIYEMDDELMLQILELIPKKKRADFTPMNLLDENNKK
ncbi:MAG: hypothetical protein QY303_04515 [Vicingaceae bacterium]|nr:MAG: hypothetical protein QY303_04515 [Vicingaceae bacterium]